MTSVMWWQLGAVALLCCVWRLWRTVRRLRAERNGYWNFARQLQRTTHQWYLKYEALADQNQMLTQALRHDVFLSQLRNRLGLEESYARMCAAVERRRHGGRPITPAFLAYIDLDRFKSINDTLGHHVADRMLEALADTLDCELRTGDYAARIGGDEFVVVMVVSEQTIMERRLAEVCEGYQDRCRVRIPALDGMRMTASIGIAPLACDTSDDLQRSLEWAEAAMRKAKQLGGGRIECTSSSVPNPSL